MTDTLALVSTHIFDCMISARPITNYYLDARPKKRSKLLHNHLMHEIHVSRSDDVIVFFDNESVNLHKNHSMIIPAGVYHRDNCVEDYEKVLIIRLQVERNRSGDDRIYDAICERLSAPHFTTELPESAVCALNEFITEYKAYIMGNEKEKMWHLERSRHILALFFIEYFMRAGIYVVQRATEDIKDDSGIRTIIDRYFYYNINKKPTVEDLATIISYSTAQTKRLLRKFYSVSFTEKLRSDRVKMAKDLLENTNDKIEKIAYDVGYKSRIGFEKMFLTEMGISPAAYRQKSRKQAQIPTSPASAST